MENREDIELFFEKDTDKAIVVNNTGPYEITEYGPNGPILRCRSFYLTEWHEQLIQGKTGKKTFKSPIKYNRNSDAGKYMFDKAVEDPRYRVLPNEVENLLQFLQKYNLPVYIVPNKSFTLDGCEGASAEREYTIPAQENSFLPNELKTLLMGYGKGDNKKFIALHCRGNRKIDIEKVKNLLITQFKNSNKEAKSLKFVSPEKLATEFGLQKGTVTPFLKKESLIQLFDSDCLDSYGMPMTTNATHPEWSTQFDGKELVRALQRNKKDQNIITADIVEGERSDVLEAITAFKNEILGIIEYGFDATILFRQLLKKYTDNIEDNLKETDLEGESTIPFQRAGSFTELQSITLGHSAKLEEVMDSTKSANKITQKDRKSVV